MGTTVSPPPMGKHRSGTAAICGRPNVGKSTLLNALMGVKLAIVTPRPQTTRNRIAGIKTVPGGQIVFFDTPGIHRPRGGLNYRLVESARRTMAAADLVLLVIDARSGILRTDRDIATTLRNSGTPTLTVVNKIDLISHVRLLPLMQTLGNLLPDSEIVPVSALKREHIDTVLGLLWRLLPVGPPLYPEEQITDQSDRFIAQEIIREKVFRLTHAEVPYGTTVIVEEFRARDPQPHKGPLVYVRATVILARQSQKGIIIGERGQRLKEIGRLARLELQEFFGKRFFVELYVKVEKGWDTNPAVLAEIGL